MIELVCPHCGLRMNFPKDKRVKALKEAACQFCGGDITREMKRAYLKELALDISIDILKKENQEFFEQLEEKWREHFSSDSL